MILYDSIVDAVEEAELPVAERGQLYTAVIEYAHFGREPQFKMTKAATLCFQALRPLLDTQRTKRDAGRKGGLSTQAKRKQNESTPSSRPQADHQAESGSACAGNGEANSNSNSNKERLPNGSPKKAPEKFEKPSVQDVAAYAAERGNPRFDAEKFVDHYASNGWKVGRNPMRDWKAAVRNWMRKDGPGGTAKEAVFHEYGD